MMMNRNFNPSDLLAASKTLRENKSWAIFTHRKSDGDAMGSAAALFEAGTNLGKNVSWFSPDEKLPEGYRYLPHFGDFRTCEDFSFIDDRNSSAQAPVFRHWDKPLVCYNKKIVGASTIGGELVRPEESGKFEDTRIPRLQSWGVCQGTLYVFLDCASETRSVSGYEAGKGINSLNIDHHEDNSLYARVNCVDGSASSTCEMLYRIFDADNWVITQRIAESLYTGIFTDTGGFSFSNTSPLTHNIAAELIKLGVEPALMTDRISQNKNQADLQIWARALSRVKVFGEGGIFAVSMIYADDFRETGADTTGTEGLSQMFMSVRGVKFIAVATEYPDGAVRLSIRSRDGAPFGAGEFAREFGGGGHQKAAGCNFDYPAKSVMAELESSILRKYHECLNTHQ